MQRGRKKGTPKTGGRVKGIPSKRTAEILNRAENLLRIIEQGENLEKDIAKMSPTSRLILYKDTLDFVQPRLQRTDHHGNGIMILNIQSKSNAIPVELAASQIGSELQLHSIDGE